MKHINWVLIAVLVIQMLVILLIYNQINPNQKIEGVAEFEYRASSVGISAVPGYKWSQYKKEWNGEVLVNYIGDKKLEFSEKYIRTMKEKGDHLLVTIHPEFEERKKRLDHFCQFYPSENNHLSFQIPGRYLYNEFYEIASCLPPKTSSTQWVEIFTILAEFKENFSWARTAVLEYRNLSLAYHLKHEEFIARAFQVYLKFYTVRHPFERLLSAFYSKLRDNSSMYERKYGPEIIRYNYLQGYPTEEAELTERLRGSKASQVEEEWLLSQLERMKRVGRSFNLTFLEFVTYITKVKNRNELEQHWKPMVLLCNPCILNYDVIMKFETIHKDANDLLNFVAREKPRGPTVSFPESKVSITRGRCNKEFSTVPVSIRNKLYKIFEEDFIFYNYTTSLDNPC